jgi:hypothetical protein
MCTTAHVQNTRESCFCPAAQATATSAHTSTTAARNFYGDAQPCAGFGHTRFSSRNVHSKALRMASYGRAIAQKGQTSVPKIIATPSRFTLGRAPTRALMFLLGVGRNAEIRGLLQARGYTPAEHERGWKLLRAVDPSKPDTPLPSAANNEARKTSNAAREAGSQIEAWAKLNLPIAAAALQTREPTMHHHLFKGITISASGAAVFPEMMKFLDRVDTLELRARSEEKKARGGSEVGVAQRTLQLLESRGMGETERKRVRAWFVLAQAMTTEVHVVQTTSCVPAMLALHTWLSEWTFVAKKVLTQRRQHIALGMSERRSKTSQTTQAAETTR